MKKYGFGVDIADSLQIARKRNNLERKQIIGIGVEVPRPVTAEGKVLRTTNIDWENKGMMLEFMVA